VSTVSTIFVVVVVALYHVVLNVIINDKIKKSNEALIGAIYLTLASSGFFTKQFSAQENPLEKPADE